MQVRFMSSTVPEQGSPCRSAEDILVYTARVSSPQNQVNLDTGAKLLRYCIRNKHWSVFDMADLTVEIKTSRAISAQILRHQSFKFQEFSQRYAEVVGFETYEARRQDTKNRQNSLDDLSDHDKAWFRWAQDCIQSEALELYNLALSKGIAKECARFLLPMSAETTLYMKGSVRSWIHYLEVRRSASTQKEHRDVADAVWPIFKQVFPTVAEALEDV